MKRYVVSAMVSIVIGIFVIAPLAAGGAKVEPIVIGVPSSLKTLEASEGLNAIIMAAEEINKAGGVKIGSCRHAGR